MATTSPVVSSGESLYTRSASPPPVADSNPYPPGTIETARVETIDNDRACLMLDAGVVR